MKIARIEKKNEKASKKYGTLPHIGKRLEMVEAS